jgi:hypothetical protein
LLPDRHALSFSVRAAGARQVRQTGEATIFSPIFIREKGGSKKGFQHLVVVVLVVLVVLVVVCTRVKKSF